jgi:hypothetical protein
MGFQGRALTVNIVHPREERPPCRSDRAEGEGWCECRSVFRGSFTGQEGGVKLAGLFFWNKSLTPSGGNLS